MAITPENDNIIEFDNIQEKPYPTNSWLINKDTQTLERSDDTIALMLQSIEIRVMLERFAYPVFTPNAGLQTVDLPGEPFGIVIAELKRRIEACLREDDRVIGMSDFSYRVIDKESIEIQYTANTIYGDYQREATFTI